MAEEKLKIEVNGQYKNVRLIPKYVFSEDGQLVKTSPGLSIGNHVILTKGKFAGGREIQGKFGPAWSCRAYQDEDEVSFWLNNEEDHKNYEACGGVDDTIKVTMTSKEYTFQGQKRIKCIPVFELVE